MERTVVQGHSYVHHRVTCQHTALHLLLYAFVYGRNIIFRYDAAGNIVDELIAVPRRLGFDFHYHVSVLSAPAGLTHEPPFRLLHRFADGFAVSHLGFADVGVHLEFPFQTVHDYFQVQLSHA